MGTRIYVGNLSTRVTESDLEDEFKKFGVVRNIWVARQPPGFAFVVMEDDRDAEDAIHKMDGMHGWKVEFSRKDTQRRPDRSGPGRNGNEVFRCYECGEPGHLARDCRLRQNRVDRYDRNRGREWRRSRSRSYDRHPRRERSQSRGRSPSPLRGRSFSRGRSTSRDRHGSRGIPERPAAEARPRERSRDRSFSRGSFDRPREEELPEKRTSASPVPRG